ncbi:unnamed protein product, partial [Rodentolepis nana]|uniref:Ovule protein n=1 Tax=Rodentolepis nana TaxID=102285 RepID=A0A0R3TI36_RODNA
PDRSSNQLSSSSDSNFQVITPTSLSQPSQSPPPPLQSIPLVRVESPKSPPKSPLDGNVDSQKRSYLLNFLLPHRGRSNGVVGKPRCKGGVGGGNTGCPEFALSTRLDTPD